MNGTFDQVCCFEYSEGILHCMQLSCKHSLSVLVVLKSNGLSYRLLANTQTLLICPKLVQSFLIFPSKDFSCNFVIFLILFMTITCINKGIHFSNCKSLYNVYDQTTIDLNK